MLKKNVRLVLQFTRRLWVRVVGLSALSLLAVAIAPVLGPVLPWEASDRFDADAIRPILNLLSSAMLVVTTFSLNVMVSAYRNAAGEATPRAYRLLLEDTTTQTVLATFTGAFIYSLLTLILLNAGVYDGKATLVVFGFSVFVVVLIILAILRWIDHLSALGNMDHTMQTIEDRAAGVLKARQSAPAMGARAVTADQPLPEGAQPIVADRTGYVRFIDVGKLQEVMEDLDGNLRLAVRPGGFVARGEVLAHVSRGSADRDTDTSDTDKALRGAFDIGALRSFDQDPRYGLTVLAEIGVRALSPGVNDPGTAIEAVHRIERLLWDHGGVTGGPAAPDTPDEELPCPRVEAVPFAADALVRTALGPFARHAGDELDMLRHLASCCARLARHGDAELATAAREMGGEVLTRARRRELDDADYAEIERIISGPGTTGSSAPGG